MHEGCFPVAPVYTHVHGVNFLNHFSIITTELIFAGINVFL